VEVARALPEVMFEVGGAATGKEGEVYAQPIQSAAASLPNLILHGRIPREDMAPFYSRLHLFCCTSVYEGFPNTFLEAWSHGLPIVSTFDPDNCIAERGLGRVATDARGLIDGIRCFVENREAWIMASVQSRAYYLHNHTVDEVMVRFERLFMETLQGKRRALR